MVFIQNLVFIIILCFSSAFAQNQSPNLQEIGKPFLKYYGPKVYKSATTNWCIIQDKRGIMYFGNEEGLLEFDGNSWRKIEIPYSSLVRSIAMDDNGRIYLCASLDFGYLEPDSVGQLKFTSLKKHLPENYKNTGEIWDVNVNSKGVYFKTKDKIFRWDGNEYTVWDSVFSYRFYKINDNIYARNNGTGLMEIKGDSIYVIPGGEFFSSTGVFNMLPFSSGKSNPENKFLITTNYKGLFLIDGGNVSPFKTEANSFLTNNQVYNACILSDGIFAFATQRGGVAIIDREGRLVQILNENTGLSTNIIYDVYPDKQGGLWLATNDGIVHVELISPFSVLPAEGLLKSSVYSLLRFKDYLYACNDLGIIYLKDGKSSFKLLEGSNKPAYQLVNTHGSIFAATNWGLRIVDGDKFGKELSSNTINVILPSKLFPDLFYIAGRGELFVIKKQKNNLLVMKLLTDKTDDVSNIVEDEDSTLWVKSFEQPIIHITSKMKGFEEGLAEPINIVDYKEVEGLPGNKWNIFNVQNRLVLATDKGIFKFDKETKTFTTDSILGSRFTNTSHTISLMTESKNGGFWILANTKEGSQLGRAIPNKNGSYDWKPDPLFNRTDLSSVVSIYADYDSVQIKENLWLSNDEGLVHYNPSIPKNIDKDYTVLIREVTVANDSLIYGGSSFDEYKQFIIPSSSNDIRFEYSATSYDKPQANNYQYILDGFDDKWSSWTNEFKKDYTNLSGGHYKFHVRAKNIYGVISNEAVFDFKILSPWYLSWWAYSFYIVIFFLGAFISDRLIRRRIIAKERGKAEIALLEAENERKSEELEEARQLQLSMLPKDLPNLPNLDIAVYMQTATEVGGDYYDFHVGMDGTLTVVVGDATGHGMKAGTMVTTTKSLFNILAPNSDILATFSEISRVIKAMKFHQLSMCLMLLKIKGDKLFISSAAMPPALIYRRKKQAVEEIFIKGMPLGAMNNFPYSLNESQLQTGDTMLLLSDGLPELTNDSDEMYGYDRTKTEFNSVGKKEPEEIVNHLKNSASQWVNGKDLDDDVTFVVIKMK